MRHGGNNAKNGPAAVNRGGDRGRMMASGCCAGVADNSTKQEIKK